jgi:hypothetical protein
MSLDHSPRIEESTSSAVRPRLLTDEMTFCAWVSQAEPHDVFEYHRGFLILDCDPGKSSLPWEQRAELDRVARKARDASRQKLVCLVQRRWRDNEYSYLAVVRQSSHAPASMAAILIDEAA